MSTCWLTFLSFLVSRFLLCSWSFQHCIAKFSLAEREQYFRHSLYLIDCDNSSIEPAEAGCSIPRRLEGLISEHLPLQSTWYPILAKLYIVDLLNNVSFIMWIKFSSEFVSIGEFFLEHLYVPFVDYIPILPWCLEFLVSVWRHHRGIHPLQGSRRSFAHCLILSNLIFIEMFMITSFTAYLLVPHWLIH